ncbi:hypothetical protein DH86_00003847 [Scytalidium sp. 3C]|nr:hypothetical protein DH86_00003847 [Scytalidium sp. 3C]
MAPNILSKVLAVGLLAAGAAAKGTPVLEARASSTSLTPITRFTRAVNDSTSAESITSQELGINTIRVYAVDNSVNHDECMNALAEAGIYLVLDTDNSEYSLNRNDCFESYNSVFLQSVFATIDAFANYTNTLAFLSGNEVINNYNNTDCAPYVKAVVRDMKQYIGSRGYRSIPVGYSAADVESEQQVLAEYLNCGTNDQRSDFYAINDYSWCDPSSFTTSGWDTLVANYTGYGIPLFMSEYGCITNNRTFQEVSALYNTEMTSVFSGGLVYEYSEEGNGYGLVTISPDGTSVTPNDDFTYLKSAYAAQTNPSGNGGATSTSAASTCPTASSNWNVTNDDLPAIPSQAAEYMKTGAGKGPGLDGPGSQEAGGKDTESQGTATPGSGSVTAVATGASATSTGKTSGGVMTVTVGGSHFMMELGAILGIAFLM